MAREGVTKNLPEYRTFDGGSRGRGCRRGRPITETGWLQATSLTAMLETLDRLRSEGYWRHCTMFVCGWVRLNWHDLVDDRSRAAIEIIELFQDGRVNFGEVQRANLMAHEAAWELRNPTSHADDPERQNRVALAATDAACVASRDPFDCIPDLARSNQYRNQAGIDESKLCDLLWDTFGNPYRPVVIGPSWSTPTSTALARGMYESRDFSAMSTLADALQDAGCNNADILAHCRGSGPHVRGCWAVELVLNKE
jgi:hypothetical protein